MATQNVQIVLDGNALQATPAEVSVSKGDELVITNTLSGPVKLALSNDTIGRLSPMPDAIVPLSPNETIQFTVGDLANRAYEIALNAAEFPAVAPAGENPDPRPNPVIRFLPNLQVGGTGGGGGFEELP